MRYEILAVLFIEVNDDFGIGPGAEAMPPLGQFGGDLRESIQLTVQHRPHRAIFVGERLLSMGQVDNGQPRIDQKGSAGAADVIAPFIRSPVPDGRNDGRDERRINSQVGVKQELAGYSTHWRGSSCRSVSGVKSETSEETPN